MFKSKQRLLLRMENRADGETVFDATLSLTARPMTAASLNGLLLRYPLLTAKVATAQTGQKFLFTANDGQPVEQAVPYTIGVWQTTEAVPVTLKSGANTLHFEIAEGSRGVTIKEFTLTPAK